MRGGDLANQIKALHAMVKLRDRQGLVGSGLAQAALGDPRLISGPYAVSVIAEAVADASGALASIAKRQGNRVLGLARHDPGRPDDAAIADHDLEIVAVGNGQSLRKRWTHRDDITPGQRRQRLWQFLQPADIGELSVPNCRVGPEDDVEALACWLLALGVA